MWSGHKVTAPERDVEASSKGIGRVGVRYRWAIAGGIWGSATTLMSFYIVFADTSWLGWLLLGGQAVIAIITSRLHDESELILAARSIGRGLLVPTLTGLVCAAAYAAWIGVSSWHG